MLIRLIAGLIAVFHAATTWAGDASGVLPNIVWIIGEDMGPELGCYGDRNAVTPNIDRLAAERAGRQTRQTAPPPAPVAAVDDTAEDHTY